MISLLFSHHHTTKSHLNCLSQFNNVKLVWHRFKWLNGYHQTTEPVCRLPVPKTKLEQIVYCTTNIFCTVFFFFCKGLFVDIYNKCHIHHRKQWWVFVKCVIVKMDLVAVAFLILSIFSSLSNRWQLRTIEYSTQSLLYIYWQLEIDEYDFDNDILTILTNKQRNCHHIRHYTLFQWIITK